MNKKDDTVWRNEATAQFALVLAEIRNQSDMQSFLSDVLTTREITEVAARLEAARMLSEGCKYTDIIAKTKLSSRTVARISEWLREGAGGYSIAVQLINEHHAHISPARN